MVYIVCKIYSLFLLFPVLSVPYLLFCFPLSLLSLMPISKGYACSTPVYGEALFIIILCNVHGHCARSILTKPHSCFDNSKCKASVVGFI